MCERIVKSSRSPAPSRPLGCAHLTQPEMKRADRQPPTLSGAVYRLLVLNEIAGVSTRSSLPSVLVFKESHTHDLKVERQGPILHVPKVIVNSF